jgi:hypothetical protein
VLEENPRELLVLVVAVLSLLLPSPFSLLLLLEILDLHRCICCVLSCAEAKKLRVEELKAAAMDDCLVEGEEGRRWAAELVYNYLVAIDVKLGCDLDRYLALSKDGARFMVAALAGSFSGAEKLLQSRLITFCVKQKGGFKNGEK